MECLSACSSKKSNMYLMASGSALPLWAVLKMVSKRSSTNFCNVPWEERHKERLFCAAANLVTLFSVIPSNVAKCISLTPRLFHTSSGYIYYHKSHCKVRWEWILSLSLIKANWHIKTAKRQGDENSLRFLLYIDSNCRRYAIFAFPLCMYFIKCHSSGGIWKCRCMYCTGFFFNSLLFLIPQHENGWLFILFLSIYTALLPSDLLDPWQISSLIWVNIILAIPHKQYIFCLNSSRIQKWICFKANIKYQLLVTKMQGSHSSFVVYHSEGSHIISYHRCD